MKYKQERRVMLSTESEHDSLYRWSIQEIKADGSLKKRDWIPWYHSVYFQINDLTHFQNMKIEKKSDNDDFVAGSEAEPSAIEATISGTLRPM